MFEVLSKAILEVTEKDEEKLQKRKSKRLSARAPHGLHGPDSESEFDGDLFHDPENGDHVDKAASGEGNSLASDDEEDEDELLEDRTKWDNNYIVVIHMIGFAVGGSNVWGFGFLCHEYGGIAFMIPYLLLTLFCALPYLYLELLIGQYAQVGAIACWKLAPLFKGVGLCMLVLSFISSFNIHSMLAWCWFYMFQSAFHRPLPWISCDNGYDKLGNGKLDESKTKWIINDHDADVKNWHTANCTEFYADSGVDDKLKENQLLPGSEYFRGRVQRMWKSYYADAEKDFNQSNGEVTFGLNRTEEGILEYNADTFICLLIACLVLRLVIIKDIHINSKFMFGLVVSPYVLLVMLFYRATGLSGAWTGLRELWKPNFSKLWETVTWRKCAEQVLFSTGCGYGIHLTCASHNKFNRRIAYDAAIVVGVNVATSLLSACTVFMYLGHVQIVANRELRNFVRSGPELAFEVMADVLSVLAKPNFYAFSFYLFLSLLSFSTLVTYKMSAKISILEVLPMSVKYKAGARTLLITLMHVASLVISSVNMTRGGLHFYNFMNTFNGSYSLVLSSLMFLFATAWIFGLQQIVDATGAMGIRAPGMFFQISWKYFSPIVLSIILFGLIFDPASHEVTFDNHKIELDTGVYIVGYIIAFAPFFTVITGAMHALWCAPGKNFKEKFLVSISPTSERTEILETGTGKRTKAAHYFYTYAHTPGTKCNVFCSFHRKSKVGHEDIPVIGPDDQTTTSSHLDIDTLLKDNSSRGVKFTDHHISHHHNPNEKGKFPSSKEELSGHQHPGKHEEILHSHPPEHEHHPHHHHHHHHKEQTEKRTSKDSAEKQEPVEARRCVIQ